MNIILGYVNNIVMALKYGSQHWGLPALDRTSSPIDVDMIDDMSWTDDMQGKQLAYSFTIGATLKRN